MLYFAHDAFHQCGLSFAVASHKCYFVAPLNGEAGVAEHHVVAIRLAHAVHNDGIVTRARRWRKLEPQGRSIFFVHFEEFELFEHLHTTLHLQGLGVGAFEAFDKLFGLGNELLLFVVGLLLLFAAFLAKFQVFGVVHLVVVNASHGHLDGTGGDVVHKLAVVADDDYRLSVIDEEVFQPLDGLDVQVVGRLVEQQHVGLLEKQLGQLDAHAPTTAEVACGTAEIRTLKAEAQQGLFHVFLVVGGIDGVEFFAQRRYLFDELHVAVALVVGTGFQFFVQSFYFGLHFVQVGESLCRFFEHGTSIFGHQVLGQVGDDTILGSRYLAAGGLAYAGQNLEQGAFPGTVFAHQGNAVFFIDYKRYVTEQGGAAKFYGQSIYVYHMSLVWFYVYGKGLHA